MSKKILSGKNYNYIYVCSIFDIETLYIYHLNGDVVDYNVSALGRYGTCLRFSGPGPMFVSSITPNRVYFQLFITNTTVSKFIELCHIVKIGMRG